jgi:transcriptional regulator GlxA family with amidase domain
MSLLPPSIGGTLQSMTPRPAPQTHSHAARRKPSRSLLRSALPQASAGHHVLCLGYEQAMSLDITGPLQVFASANDMRARQGLAPFYVISLLAAEAGPITTSSGLQMLATQSYKDCKVDANCTVLVPGGDGVDLAQHDLALRQWLQAAEPVVQRMGSVCSGALVLAQAGLLQDRAATTHWCRVQELRETHPDICVDHDRLHTYDARDAQARHLFTSAGVTAGIDLALALVEDDLGSAMALAVARHLVMFVRRPGGQAQFSPLLTPEPSHAPRLAQLLEWIPGQLGSNLGVERLAQQSCLPPRTLARVFQRELGTTPARYVEQVRVQAAATLLGQRQASVATVAKLCGFGHPESLRRSFHKHLSISPQAFAERFGSG